MNCVRCNSCMVSEYYCCNREFHCLRCDLYFHTCVNNTINKNELRVKPNGDMTCELCKLVCRRNNSLYHTCDGLNKKNVLLKLDLNNPIYQLSCDHCFHKKNSHGLVYNGIELLHVSLMDMKEIDKYKDKIDIRSTYKCINYIKNPVIQCNNNLMKCKLCPNHSIQCDICGYDSILRVQTDINAKYVNYCYYCTN
jgi:hypothetical protein